MTALSIMLSGGMLFAAELPLHGKAASLEFFGEGEVGVFKQGAVLFTDRHHIVAECPEWLNGKPFLKNSIDRLENWRVAEAGVLTVLTPESYPKATTQIDALEAAGFTWIKAVSPFQLFGRSERDRVRIYQKQADEGERFRFGKWVVAVAFAKALPQMEKAWSQNTGEELYNGIVLPEEWPPLTIDPADDRPMPVPYLDHPPSVIPIDVGRQLFVDDFLIGITDLERTFHYPEKYEGNPVLKPETPLELGIEGEARTVRMSHLATGLQPLAGPKSGGLWWNPELQLFELWYEAGWIGTICYAVSHDGLHWERPDLDIRPGTNQALPKGLYVDSWTVVRDEGAEDPAARYKLFISTGRPPGTCHISPDGIHWSDGVKTGYLGDRSTMFYNPFRKKWVFSIRAGFRGRSRRYRETDDFLHGAQWKSFGLFDTDWRKGQPVLWTAADSLDAPDPEIGIAPQLYNLDAVAYESIMLGMFEIHRGPHNKICAVQGTPKITDLNFAYSRDGFHWSRPDRTAALRSERKDGTWDKGYVQSLGNLCTVQGDRLFFYYSAFAGDPANVNTNTMMSGMYANGATGVAFLRRDGFASMDAGADPGTLTTRPVVFSGKHLFVNVDAPQGKLRAEVIGENGHPVEPFTLSNCNPLTADGTIKPIIWKDGSDLSGLAGKPVRFRFELENGSLYSFWVSLDETGRSDGYIAGGGPGYTGATDTVGSAALEANKKWEDSGSASFIRNQ